MALVVEDGTGKADATCYVSVATADAYWTDHGGPATWSGAAVPSKEAALLYATQWIDGFFSWLAGPLRPEQALDWPCSGFSDTRGRWVAAGTIPARLVAAVCEAAKVHLESNGLNASLKRGGRLRRVKASSIEVSYSQGAPGGIQLPHVERLLSDFIVPGGAIRPIRA